jgi:hypothetical protein
VVEPELSEDAGADDLSAAVDLVSEADDLSPLLDVPLSPDSVDIAFFRASEG